MYYIDYLLCETTQSEEDIVAFEIRLFNDAGSFQIQSFYMKWARQKVRVAREGKE